MVEHAKALLRLPLCVAMICPALGTAQTLDEAVADRITGFENDCDPFSSEPVPPREDGHQPPGDGFGPGSSSGGGASTPVSLPLIEQQRLRGSADPAGERTRPVASLARSSVATSADPPWSPYAAYVVAGHEDLHRSTTPYESGYRAAMTGITLGAVFGASETTTAGFSISAADRDGDFTEGGDFEESVYGLALSGTMKSTRSSRLWLGGRYVRTNGERTRNASFELAGSLVPFCQGSPQADYATHHLGIDLLFGHRLPLGSWQLDSAVGIGWQRTGTDTFTETSARLDESADDPSGGRSGLELIFHGNSRGAVRSIVSVGLGRLFLVRRWRLQPTLGVRWLHDHGDDRQALEASLVSDPDQLRLRYFRDRLDRDHFVLDAGLTVSARGGRAVLFADYRTLARHDHLSGDSLSLGVDVLLD